jgi:cation diffusion facilitator CzcD-associated flavoprotein CzcO
MSTQELLSEKTPSGEETAVRRVDVVIVGAGLSGVGAACHLSRYCQDKSFVILEARPVSGGTWDLFRYPGVRSDSDMFTLGYRFRPWRGEKALADGPSILSYIRETAAEHKVEDRICYHHRVTKASWSSKEARWRVEAERPDGSTAIFSCSFLFANSGYYRYESGYTPEFPGIGEFTGQVVHPQHWPPDLDYEGKEVVVIGSGATAVTLVPAMAKLAARVTMLQRSPTYIASLPATDPLAKKLRKRLPERVVYPLVRWKNVLGALVFFQLSRKKPEIVKRLIRRGLEASLPPGYDIDTHFKPDYEPWDQRMCFVPDGDLFAAIRAGTVEVVTDRIETFTTEGIRLESGRELLADIVVTATGLSLQMAGGMELDLDGEKVELSKTVGYRGIMFSGVPNFASTMGYTNASWTLKADLAATYVCRLLNYMERHGYAVACAEPPDPSLPTQPWLDLTSGYVLRSLDSLPRQGQHAPWRLYHNYILDLLMLRYGSVRDRALAFQRRHR